MQPGEGVMASWLRIADGKIVAVGSGMPAITDGEEIIDGGGRLLTPGLIDLHTHGVATFAYDGGPEQLLEASHRLPGFGVTCVLQALCCHRTRAGLRPRARLADALPLVTDVAMPGFHVEGPFVAVAGAACRPIPGDVDLLNELWDAMHGRIVALSLSPETPNIRPVIEQLVALGVAPFVTHTEANVEQTQAAIDAGAQHATHSYDVFYPPNETDSGVRPVGAVEAFLADPRCSVDFIADGVHVHPTAIHAALAAEKFRNVACITDANIGAGLPPGVYDSPVGGQIKTGDVARMLCLGSPDNGGLPGSTLPMDAAVSSLLAWLVQPEREAWAMATANPARIARLANQGTLCVGADADLVLWDRANGRLSARARGLAGGKPIYHNQQHRKTQKPWETFQ